jgi:release factor glutamine methyltransferase
MSTHQKAKSKSIGEWIANATRQLTDAGIGSSKLDATLLAQDQTGLSKTALAAHPETELSAEDIQSLNQNLDRRCSHEPLAYIRGKVEFYGRDFIVNHDVLVPRPETEQMIELLLDTFGNQQCKIVDIGTGSGAIAITVKAERPTWHVTAIDIDANCITIAKKNAAALKASVVFTQSDLASFTYPADSVLLANLPYVPNSTPINDAAKHEPSLAIWGGEDGLEAYRHLFCRLETTKTVVHSIFTEALLEQHTALKDLAAAHGYKLTSTRGLCQLFQRA